MNYWIKELYLQECDRLQLEVGDNLTDRHITATAKILSQQFPDIPTVQSCLLSQKLSQIQLAKNGSLFFHNIGNNWITSHFKDGVVFLYDSLYTEVIHSELKKQLIALYGSATVKIPWLVKQKGDKDCGCFAVAYAVSILYGDDPVNCVYDQSSMRQHMTECFNINYYTPFPSMPRKSRRSVSEYVSQLP